MNHSSWRTARMYFHAKTMDGSQARISITRPSIEAPNPSYPRPGIQLVPASGTWAIAAASTVSATMSSGSRL